MKRSLFRALYIREGRLRGVTFAAWNAALAADFAYTRLESLIKSLDPKLEILDVVPAKLARRAR